MVLYLAKVATFNQFGVLNHTVIISGLAIGIALMIGPFLARPLLRRLHTRTYGLLIDLELRVAGIGIFVAT